MRKYREYTDEEVIQGAKKVKSMAGILKEVGLAPAGGNYVHMKKTLQRLKVDCSHWTGQAWNKDQQLKDWSDYSKVESLKPHLIKLRGHQCQNKKCKRETWLGLPIPLETHHIDGDKTNNSLDNLLLLCYNCHGQTKNFRRPKRSQSGGMADTTDFFAVDKKDSVH